MCFLEETHVLAQHFFMFGWTCFRGSSVAMFTIAPAINILLAPKDILVDRHLKTIYRPIFQFNVYNITIKFPRLAHDSTFCFKRAARDYVASFPNQCCLCVLMSADRLPLLSFGEKSEIYINIKLI